MDDAAFVGGIERACHLSRQGDRLFEWQRAARQQIGKRGTFDEFEHESPHGMALEQLVVDPVNSADVLVVERSEHLGFAFEAGEAFGVAGERVRENLDGHLAPERGVSRAIHLTHAACPKSAGDLECADARAWRQRHVWEAITLLASGLTDQSPEDFGSSTQRFFSVDAGRELVYPIGDIRIGRHPTLDGTACDSAVAQ